MELASTEGTTSSARRSPETVAKGYRPALGRQRRVPPLPGKHILFNGLGKDNYFNITTHQARESVSTRSSRGD